MTVINSRVVNSGVNTVNTLTHAKVSAAQVSTGQVATEVSTLLATCGCEGYGQGYADCLVTRAVTSVVTTDSADLLTMLRWRRFAPCRCTPVEHGPCTHCGRLVAFGCETRLDRLRSLCLSPEEQSLGHFRLPGWRRPRPVTGSRPPLNQGRAYAQQTFSETL